MQCMHDLNESKWERKRVVTPTSNSSGRQQQDGSRPAAAQWFSTKSLAHSVLTTAPLPDISISVPDAQKEGQAGEHEGDSPSSGSRKT